MTQDFDETDRRSVFAYDDLDAIPDTFSLTKLEDAVSKCIGRKCNLVKLAEGGFHKVYEVLTGAEPSGVVARVAAPAFPKDKVESEVRAHGINLINHAKIATMQYIASYTNIHTPQVHGWNTESTNPVGLEYMILEKIIGIPASDVWDTLSSELKEIVVSEVADHIIQIFRLRFGTGGSLYTGTDKKTFVGPIVAIPFYRALDGVVRLPEPVNRAFELHRAPFDKSSNYLRSVLDAELRIIEDHYQHILEHEFDGDENRLKLGIRVLEKAVKLSSIDQDTGHITGLIDFESTTVAPLWDCAYIPRWLQDPNEWDATYEGGAAEDRKPLRELFLKKIEQCDPTGEWIRALERGRPFREFTHRMDY
ncbi:hypothetical protein B0H13DRAFT_2542885, partial [Mycena leptocephala]